MKTSHVKPIPEGYRTITPVLTVRDAAQVIEFYKEAFGAEERYRMMTPDGKWVAHAELKIGDSIFMLSDEMPGMESSSPASLGGTSVWFFVYVEDVDAAFERAVAAGATVKMPVQDMFWGDRTGEVADPAGHRWTLATHIEDLSPEETAARGREFFEKMMQGAESV
ncbi:MAG: VOC family protein [Planctomycetes bacterium]|nr:VOC family protein [Planctomycetota bacterium]